MSKSELEILSNHALDALNTMALPGSAEYYCEVEGIEEIRQALSFAHQRQLPISVLGGGSNIVLAGDISGLVIKVGLKGVSVEPQNDDTVLVTAQAGEVWHDLVLRMLDQGYYGIENLSLIPGLVGAAPVQNIGAYGVELSDCFVALNAIEIATGKLVRFSREDCQFAYRHSIFKADCRNTYLIVSVTLVLQCKSAVNTSYPALQKALLSYADRDVTPKLVSTTVCNIRRAKLPNPAIESNVGSFFKNPLITLKAAEILMESYADIVTYSQVDDSVKVSAAWLIEQAGWKGVKVGDCCVHPQHALVLSHNGNATGRDILALAEQIKLDIGQRFNIELEIEPQVLGG